MNLVRILPTRKYCKGKFESLKGEDITVYKQEET